MPRLVRSTRRTSALVALAASLLIMLSPWASPRAEAFCGFYVSGATAELTNNATMVVMMREGQRTILSMQNNYEGPPQDFALVVPVPVILAEENVKTLDPAVFADVDRMASPRLVEYWEQDPCQEDVYPDEPGMAVMDSMPISRSTAMEEEDDTTVVVEAQFKVGEYEVVILSAKESTGLDRWLRREKYNIPAGADVALAPYVEQGLYFFVAKVDVKKVKFEEGRAKLSPLRFHYDTDTFTLPVRLGLLNARGAQDLVVHILARGQRYQVVNRKNLTIPTNIDVKDEVRQRFGEFYAALFDRVQAKDPGAVVTEYAWDASSCDPCPGPTLTPEHFMTLGADAIPGSPQWGYTLTRLHTRYTKDTLGDDLVFAAAPPIQGGREIFADTNEVEQGAKPSSINNFQGRYIIRHAWEGPIACENPRRGRWGGPPNDPYGQSIQPAMDLAFAPRGKLELATVLTKPMPEVDLGMAELEAVANTEPRTPPAIPPGAVGQQGGCASCSVVGVSSGEGWLVGLGLAALAGLVWARRRG